MLALFSIQFLPTTHSEGWSLPLMMWLFFVTPTAIGQRTTAGLDRDAGSPAVAKSPRPESGVKWAVVIGISNYRDPRIPNLNYCVDDAELLAKQLAEQCDYEPDRNLPDTASDQASPTAD